MQEIGPTRVPSRRDGRFDKVKRAADVGRWCREEVECGGGPKPKKDGRRRKGSHDVAEGRCSSD